MSRIKKIIRNGFIVIIAFLLFIKFSEYYFTPLSAHKVSEQSMHYGPSEVKHIEGYEKGKYILCEYEKSISCDIIDRSLIFLWHIGSGEPTGFVYNSNIPFDYTSGSNSTANISYTYIYGIVNDPSITKIEVTLKNGDIITQTNFYDGLFLIHWADKTGQFTKIRAYDQIGNIIEDQKYIGR